MFVLQIRKGGNDMYDYMKALYLRFHTNPKRDEELKAQYETIKQGLDREHQITIAGA